MLSTGDEQSDITIGQGACQLKRKLCDGYAVWFSFSLSFFFLARQVLELTVDVYTKSGVYCFGGTITASRDLFA